MIAADRIRCCRRCTRGSVRGAAVDDSAGQRVESVVALQQEAADAASRATGNTRFRPPAGRLRVRRRAVKSPPTLAMRGANMRMASGVGVSRLASHVVLMECSERLEEAAGTAGFERQ